jgi:hypothetical protein
MNEIFNGSDHTASMSDLNNMKYLERVIKETLRLRPSVYIIGRKVNQNLKLGNLMLYLWKVQYFAFKLRALRSTFLYISIGFSLVAVAFYMKKTVQ